MNAELEECDLYTIMLMNRRQFFLISIELCEVSMKSLTARM
jgi:hypothetical protein